MSSSHEPRAASSHSWPTIGQRRTEYLHRDRQAQAATLKRLAGTHATTDVAWVVVATI